MTWNDAGKREKSKNSEGKLGLEFLKRLNAFALAKEQWENVNRKESSFTVCSLIDSEYEIRTK
ncbi:hypothetical protein [Neorhizobium sp. JUb45]|uniref:hypothetical protein n=1 Tax=unclassified Neorhizobium TaxID=2629175 RepID=UPI00104690F3|nr:hypothetical protein [Neorhizobium sp. JUb45]